MRIFFDKEMRMRKAFQYGRIILEVFGNETETQLDELMGRGRKDVNYLFVDLINLKFSFIKQC